MIGVNKHHASFMLNRFLQTLFLCFAAFLLTTGIALGSSLPSSIHIADYTLRAAELPPGGMAKPDSQATPLPHSSQTDAPDSTQAESDRATKSGTKLTDRQPAQADPSVPYDPYDYDVIRETNREIYGEKRNQE
jgi:hypothetical protein